MDGIELTMVTSDSELMVMTPMDTSIWTGRPVIEITQNDGLNIIIDSHKMNKTTDQERASCLQSTLIDQCTSWLGVRTKFSLNRAFWFGRTSFILPTSLISISAGRNEDKWTHESNRLPFQFGYRKGI